VKVIWSPLAERRAIEAFGVIAADRPQAAAKWLRELLTRVGTLDRFPKRGRVVPEINKPAYRQILLHPYRVVYRVDAKQVVVLTIRHSRRAWDSDEIVQGV
jgi:plasmid stabilization system protein ParE